MTIRYTRYLYAIDEVLYTLQECLIKKRDLNECIFWVGEIYHSKHNEELWSFIYEFYYNFSAINNPKLEDKLFSLFDLDNLDNIINAILILFHSKISFNVFIYYIQKFKNPNKGFIRKIPKWISDNITTDKNYYKIIMSLKTENLENLSFYIGRLEDSEIDEFYIIVKKYFEFFKKDKINDVFNLHNKIYKNKKQILIAFICYMFSENYKKRHFCMIKKFDNLKYKELIKKDNTPISPKYKTLSNKLRYKISSTIGCFPLDRFELDDITYKEAYWYSWDYYAYDCNIWRERFNKYNIKINDEKRRIDFMDDENYEKFYELYYYEPDEQSREIQTMAIPKISKITIHEWIKLMGY